MLESHRFGCLPSFDLFYGALNSRPPFPWQSRLANEVMRDGVWPKEIGIPTGLGKTACLEVALWWLASQAELEPAWRTAPTRIWWVVNRRMLVDSTFNRAKHISAMLLDPKRADSGECVEALRAVADRLRSFSADPATAEPVEVIQLRGGVDARRPTDPSRPSIILSTVPMFGSRLLFRGYGTSRSMRAIDAALAGTDSLVLVDEAHLARHLVQLVPALSDCVPGADSILGPERSRPQVVALTATGDASRHDRFELDHNDEANSIVRQRLDAAKPLTVLQRSGDAGLRLAESTRALLKGSPGRGASCIVFANTPRTARDVFGRLGAMLPRSSTQLVLLTGRTREWEAERTREQILDRVHGMAATRDSKAARDRDLVVVATQTLEVGADVDAEFVVTEACGVRALTQRLGRLNRMGNFPGARAIYVHLPPPPRRRGRNSAAGWPVYRQEPANVLRRLLSATDASTNSVSLPPRSVAETLGKPGDDPGRAPEVLPGILHEWIKTTTPPKGEAPVEPYFSGVSGSDHSVSLIWRAYVPTAGERLWPRASDREAVSVPISDARQALGDDEAVHRLATDGVTMEKIKPLDLRPGNVIVLASDRGLLDEFGWEPNATSPVRDLTIEKYGLPLSAQALRRLFKDAAADPFSGLSLKGLVDRVLGIVLDEEDVASADCDEAISELLDGLLTAVPVGWEESEWRTFLSRLSRRRTVVGARHEVSRLSMKKGRRNEFASDDLDERSLETRAAARELEAHGIAVAERSRSIAKHVGLSARLVEVVELAGRVHDLGKADRRFQRWLDPKEEHGILLAKSDMKRHLWSRARVAAGWPKGGRHEVLSSRVVLQWIQSHKRDLSVSLRDLLLHLVISHHGSGRPIVPPSTDGTPTLMPVDIEGTRIEVAADLSVIDWDQPARFRRLNGRFGPWGLALLETIVRQADHTVSAGGHIGELESEV